MEEVLHQSSTRDSGFEPLHREPKPEKLVDATIHIHAFAHLTICRKNAAPVKESYPAVASVEQVPVPQVLEPLGPRKEDLSPWQEVSVHED